MKALIIPKIEIVYFSIALITQTNINNKLSKLFENKKLLNTLKKSYFAIIKLNIILIDVISI